jgi:hypothetical protein
MERKLKGSQQLLVHGDDVNPFGTNLNTVKRNSEALIDSSKEVGLKVNKEKAKHM